MKEEYIDILTETGDATKKVDTKSNIHKYGYWHNTAHIWVVNLQNEILIQKRTFSRKTFASLWDVSVAGHISIGESIKLGAVREVKEEIGIDLKEEDLIPMFVKQNSNTLNEGKYINNEFFNVFLVIKDFCIEDFKKKDDEVDELKFISFKKFKELIKNNLRIFANRGDYYERSINFIKNYI